MDSRLFNQYKDLRTVEKVWLKSYPPGVPAEINPDAYQSLAEIFDQSCSKFSELPAFYNLGVTITYAELDRYVRDFAAYLQQELKLKKGDRFAIMLPNTLQYPIAMFGALRAGLTVVNVNPLYTAHELVHQIRDANAETLLVLENFADTVQQALSEVPLKNIIITKISDFFSPVKATIANFVLKHIHKKIPAWHIPHAISFKETLARGKKLTFQPVQTHSEDIAFLQYTGGTTGVSKGAMLTHRNLVSNIMQADAWFNVFGEGKEIVITAIPLYHIFSLTANCLFMTKIGAKNILITNPRDLRSLVKDLAKFKFSLITGVNTLFNALLNYPAFSKLDFSALKLSLGGGMPVQGVVAERWHQVTGCVLLEAYGLTETSPCATVNPINLKAYNGTIGLPVSSTLVCLLDEEGHEVPLGEPGEIAIKGPQVMRGYWNNPEETKKVFTSDGWLLTGDIGTMDENGFVRILERKKDMILVSGFNVYPNEIEDVLMHIPGVAEAAVIGIPDVHSGEAVKAFIVKKDPNLTVETVLHFCRENLTGYKLPRQIEFRDELPKTNVGKILRRALRNK